MKNLHFLSGLPRSGSTVLCKLLNQNPSIFATTTSPFIEYTIQSIGILNSIKDNHPSGHYLDIPKILTATAFSFYNTNKDHVIDKSRGWAINYEAIDKELKKDPKVIITLRPIEEIVSSYYKVVNHINNFNESPEIIFNERIKGLYLDLLDSAKHKDKFCVVTYKQLITSPHETLLDIEEFIGASHHFYDINNITDNDPENDEKWGVKDLHKIRSKLEDHSLNPESILTKTELNFFKQLTEELYDAYEISIL